VIHLWQEDIEHEKDFVGFVISSFQDLFKLADVRRYDGYAF